MTKLVFASFNKGKRAEVASLRSRVPNPGLHVVSASDIGLSELPEETGSTFMENAMIKASAAAKASGLMAVADDSGLEVEVLGGRPGVHSARYAGDEHDDAANNSRLLSELAGQDNRRARFVCTTVLLLPGSFSVAKDVDADSIGISRIEDEKLLSYVPDGWSAFSTVGYVEGRIIDEPRGTDGFGYDPIFFRDDLGLTFAQIGREEKNRLSHRGQAFSRLVELFGHLIGL